MMRYLRQQCLLHQLLQPPIRRKQRGRQLRLQRCQQLPPAAAAPSQPSRTAGGVATSRAQQQACGSGATAPHSSSGVVQAGQSDTDGGRCSHNSTATANSTTEALSIVSVHQSSSDACPAAAPFTMQVAHNNLQGTAWPAVRYTSLARWCSWCSLMRMGAISPLSTLSALL